MINELRKLAITVVIAASFWTELPAQQAPPPVDIKVPAMPMPDLDSLARAARAAAADPTRQSAPSRAIESDLKYDRFTDSTTVTAAQTFVLKPAGMESMSDSIYLTVGLRYKGTVLSPTTIVRPYVAFTLIRVTRASRGFWRFKNANEIHLLLDGTNRVVLPRTSYDTTAFPGAGSLEAGMYALSRNDLARLQETQRIEARIGPTHELLDSIRIRALAEVAERTARAGRRTP